MTEATTGVPVNPIGAGTPAESTEARKRATAAASPAVKDDSIERLGAIINNEQQNRIEYVGMATTTH
jgi:hypothetical protein